MSMTLQTILLSIDIATYSCEYILYILTVDKCIKNLPHIVRMCKYCNKAVAPT
jgi:hypothetical protein